MKLKKYLIFLFFLALALHLNSRSGFAYESAYGEFVQNINGNEYKLKIKVSDVTGALGVGQLHQFRVYKNGKFLQSSKPDGGRITGCRVFGPEGGMKDFLNATPVETKMQTAIWEISLSTWCGGNTSHTTSHFIVVDNEYETYSEHTLDSYKYLVEMRSDSKAHVIYFYEQDWGKGGTAGSTIIPKKYVIRPNDYEPNDKLISLDELLSVTWWQEGDPDTWKKLSFVKLFKLCMDQQSPDICDYAIKNHYEEDSEKWYQSFFMGIGGEKTISKRDFQKYANLMRKKDKIKNKMATIFD